MLTLMKQRDGTGIKPTMKTTTQKNLELSLEFLVTMASKKHNRMKKQRLRKVLKTMITPEILRMHIQELKTVKTHPKEKTRMIVVRIKHKKE